MGTWAGMKVTELSDLHIPEPPCAYCAHRKRCDQERLACYRFAKYCKCANVKLTFWKRFDTLPNREIYDHIYPTEVIDWAEFVEIPSFLKPQAE